MERKDHWERVYREKSPQHVSWFQAEARMSLDAVQRREAPRDAVIVDVGGGASRFVDGLVDLGYSAVTVLDLSGAALMHARERLGAAAERVNWVEGDVLEPHFAPESVDLWHDRAVFHFLVDPADRATYRRNVRAALKPGGYLVVATFADDGPTRCSGLETARFSPEQLHAAFGDDFELVEASRETHFTPSGGEQRFAWAVMRLASPTAQND